MWPHVLRRTRYSLVLAFIAISCLTADRASSAAPRASADSTAARAASTSRPRRASSEALLAAAEQKERVPKPPSETRHKPSEKPAPKVTVDEDESTSSSCIGDCLGGFFGSLFSSAGPPSPPAPVSALREEAWGWVVGDRAWLRAPQTLWDRPGGDPEERVEAGNLPHGAPVVVVESYASAAGMWLRVRPMDGVEPSGWIPASAASAEPPPPPSGPKPPRERPTWGLQFAFGGGGVGPAELNTEYQSGVFRAESQYLRFLPKQWQSGAGLGWRYAEGNPPVLYQTATIVEEPTNSKLWMLDIGIRGGQRYTDGSGFRFDWLLGPALYYVHERADVRTFDRSTMTLIGTSVASLGRWAGGGDLRLGFGWRTGTGEIGLVVNGYAMGWKGHDQKPLSTDFVQSPIHGVDVSIAFTFPAP
jgi:hypothetical protein